MTSLFNSAFSFRQLATLGTSVLLVACFDVEQVQVYPSLLIDNFDDGDLSPSAKNFVDWRCYAFMPEEPQPTCDIQMNRADNSPALAFTYDLDVPLDADESKYGVGFSTKPFVGTVDLSSYVSIHFSAKLSPGTPAPRKNRRFLVRLGCMTVQFVPGSMPDFMLEQGFAPGGDWSPYQLELAKFRQPTGQVTMNSTQECLALNDSMRFEIADVLDGDNEQGTLMFDDVYFQ
jgi:hypothetical protein